MLNNKYIINFIKFFLIFLFANISFWILFIISIFISIATYSRISPSLTVLLVVTIFPVFLISIYLMKSIKQKNKIKLFFYFFLILYELILPINLCYKKEKKLNENLEYFLKKHYIEAFEEYRGGH
jgi:hypothetical protein